MTNPANKTVLITGAGGGFGLHMVRQFREAGAKLLITDISDAALEKAIEAAGDDLVASFVSDLSTEEGCTAVAELCRSKDLSPDILVNNAGIAVMGRFDHVPGDKWETLLQLNLLAPIRLCGEFLPAMLERDSGHIVNISSMAGHVGTEGMSSYCASKFGLRGFGESLYRDLAETGVHVTNVYPSFSNTPILDSPQYGYEQRRGVPRHMISNPANVVAEVIKGVRDNQLHVFPDKSARLLHYIARFVPWLIPILNRRLRAQSIEAGKSERDASR